MSHSLRVVVFSCFFALFPSAAAVGNSYPTQSVQVSVEIPKSTPAKARVFLEERGIENWVVRNRWELERRGSKARGVVTLPENGLVRYRYSIDENQNEIFEPGVEIHQRIVKLAKGFRFEDQVKGWKGREDKLDKNEFSGVLRGKVFDSRSGRPIVDANLSIGGFWSATDYDGSFEINGLPKGKQSLTVFTNSRNYHSRSLEVQVRDASSPVEISLKKARAAKIRMDLILPADTPDDVTLYQVGNLPKLGERYLKGGLSSMAIVGNRIRVKGPGKHRFKLESYEGAYLDYYYGFSTGWEQGRWNFQHLVSSRNERFEDVLLPWKNGNQTMVDLRVRYSPESKLVSPTLIAGPSYRLDPVSKRSKEFRTIFVGIPGTERRFHLGRGNETSEGRSNKEYRVQFTEEDRKETIRVSDWRHLRKSNARLSLKRKVHLWVSVSPEDVESGVKVVPIGVNGLESGLSMTSDQNLPTVMKAEFEVSRLKKKIRLRYLRASDGMASKEEREFEVPDTVNWIRDWVGIWSDEEQADAREGFISGQYLADYWSSEFLALLPEALRAAKRYGSEYSAISSVWSLGQLRPTPIVEPRPMRAPSVLAAREELFAAANVYRDEGMKIYFAPQFNMEMTGQDDVKLVCGGSTSEWRKQWLTEARRLWLWNAQVASEVKAEVLKLPGPCYHVFPLIGKFANRVELKAYEDAISGLIDEVKKIFKGRISLSGSQPDYEFLKKSDLVALTTYDVKQPELPLETSLSDWVEAWEKVFQERVDTVHQKTGKPIFFHTVHMKPRENVDVHIEEMDQAKKLEAFLIAVKKRPFILGTLGWAYTYVELPLRPQDGYRGRMAEAVWARYMNEFAKGQ